MSNLKIANFKDFKSRWGLESDLNPDYISQYFYFIKDALIELEDDGLIDKYNIETGSLRLNIHKDNIDYIINRICDYLKAKSTISGSINTSLIIKAPIHKQENTDTINFLENVIDRVIFLRNNGFKCELEIQSKNHLTIIVTNDIVSNRKD